jgi:HSP20 family protein
MGISNKRSLTAGELEEWSNSEEKNFWAPTWEMSETDSIVSLVVDVPGYGAGDVQVALMPRLIIVKQTVRLLASRSWKEVCSALFGPRELFRRFELPVMIDVNRVKAELEQGVLTVTAPKRVVDEQSTTKGLPDGSHAFAA